MYYELEGYKEGEIMQTPKLTETTTAETQEMETTTRLIGNKEKIQGMANNNKETKTIIKTDNRDNKDTMRIKENNSEGNP